MTLKYIKNIIIKLHVKKILLIACLLLALWGIHWHLTPTTHDIDLSQVTNIWLPFHFITISNKDIDSIFEYPTVKLDGNVVMTIIGNSEHKRIWVGSKLLDFDGFDNSCYVVFEDASNIKHLASLYPRSGVIWFIGSDKYYKISNSDRDMWDQYVCKLNRSRISYFENWPIFDKNNNCIGYEAIKYNSEGESVPFKENELGIIDHWEPEKETSGKIVHWWPVWKSI